MSEEERIALAREFMHIIDGDEPDPEGRTFGMPHLGAIVDYARLLEQRVSELESQLVRSRPTGISSALAGTDIPSPIRGIQG